jgi:hypothetical protein
MPLRMIILLLCAIVAYGYKNIFHTNRIYQLASTLNFNILPRDSYKEGLENHLNKYEALIRYIN